MSLTKKAIRGGAYTAIIRYVVFLFTFFGNLILIRLLQPQDFGIYALAISFLDIIMILNSFSINNACIQLQDEPDAFDTGYILSWLLCILLILFGVIALIILYNYFSLTNTILAVILVSIPFKALEVPATIHIARLDAEI